MGTMELEIILNPKPDSSSSSDESDADEIEQAGDYPSTIRNKMVREIRSALNRRQAIVVELQSLKRTLEESHKKRQISKIAGSVASITGAGISFAGFLLAFVTFGAGLGISVAGGMVATAGGVTAGGASIGYMVKTKERMKKVKNICLKDERQMQRVRDLSKNIRENLEQLREYFPDATEDELLELGITDLNKMSSSVPGGVIGAAVAAVNIASDGGKIGGVALRSVGRALGIAGISLGVATLFLDVILVPIDIYVLVTSAVDVHHYNEGQQVNSTAAQEVGKIIRLLEEETKTLNDFLIAVE